MNVLSIVQLRIFAALGVLGALVMSYPTYGVTTPAGTRVVSQSYADYELNGESRRTYSNEVSTTVVPVYAVSLTPPGTVSAPAFSLQGFGPDTLYATFVLANRGNAADSVALSSRTVASTVVVLDDVRFFDDRNGNDRIDPGEDDPAAFKLDAGESKQLSVALMLSLRGGSSHVEVAAASTADPALGPETSVVRVTNLTSPATVLHLGPAGNPEALPGGEGSPDDVTRQRVGLATTGWTFRNDVRNASSTGAMVELHVVDPLPVAFTVSFRDTTGQALPHAREREGAVVLGMIDPGETHTFLTEVVSSAGAFSSIVSDSLSVGIQARVVADTTRSNRTSNRIVVPRAVDANAVVQLEQTFRENRASFGDVVTMVVTVRNKSDSLRVDDLRVSEDVHPTLDFLSSPGFVEGPASLEWGLGSLSPGEKREMAVKFIVNSRTARGETRTSGVARGITMTGRVVTAGPVVNRLQIDNDLFVGDGFIIGDVFVDSDGDGKRARGERGVPGVTVFVESGEYARTDSSGRFSIPRLSPGYRVVRYEPATLPAGHTPARDPSSDRETDWRIVHLLSAGHGTVSFAVQAPPSPPVAKPDSVSYRVLCQELVRRQPHSSVVYQIPAVPSSHFESGKAYLKTEFLTQLDPIREFLSRHEGWLVLLEGHTDSIPIHNRDFPSNEVLSVARARAVARYLEANGVPSGRIVTRGYGESLPVAENASPEGRARNRRVEIGFIPVEMRHADMETIRRVQMDVADVGDSVRVQLLWDISTDAPDSITVDIELRLPDTIPFHQAKVRHGERVLAPRGERHRVAGFRRSHGFTVELVVDLPAADTALVSNIGALLRFESPRVGIHAPDVTFLVTPVPGSGAGPRAYPLFVWKSPVEGLVPPGSRMLAGLAPRDSASTFGVLSPLPDQVFTRADRIPVQVRVPVGSDLELTCNGEVVPPDRIGQRTVQAAVRQEDVTYYGVKLQTGWNQLTMRARTADGREIVDSLRVALAGRPMQLVSLRERVRVVADGRSSAEIHFAVRDELGLPVVDGIVGTVTDGAGLVSNPDARPAQTGLQVTTEDGTFTLRLSPAHDTGARVLRVETHGMNAESEISFVPPARPGFVTGIAEGTLGIFDASGQGSPLGLENYHDGTELKGESRLFVQGTTFGGANLTARLDTRQRYPDPLLEDIDVDRQYPSFGDASQQGFAAPAEGGNYVALEKSESFLRYGDFRTPFEQGEFLRYKRTASGLNGRLGNAHSGLKGFVTETDFRTVRDEIAGDGTSGFYFLSGSPVVENSVNIVLETRDRYQPERILETRPLSLNRDYTVNYFSGAVLFKQPVPVRSREFHPVVIVAIYEVETDNEAEHVYGIRAETSRGRRHRLGATLVTQDGEAFDYKLYGADGALSLGWLDLGAEFARSEDDIAGDGSAYKVESSFRSGAHQHALYYRFVEGDFSNPSFSGGNHELFSRKAGFESRIDVTPRMQFLGEGYRHDYQSTGDEKRNASAVLSYRWPSFELSGGARAARQDDSDGDVREGYLSIAGLGIHHPRGGDLRARWEHNMGEKTVDDYPDRLQSTLSIPLAASLNVVLNHEYLSAHGQPGTQRLIAGIESHLDRSTVYSKYSLNRTGSAERAGAISGVRHAFGITNRLAATIDVEGFRSFSRSLDDEYVTTKTGLGWIDGRASLVEGRYEFRWQRSVARHVLLVTGVRQFENGMSLILRDAMSLAMPDVGDKSVRVDGRIAGVYRPDASPWKWLVLLKTEYDRFSPADPEAITWKMVFSTDINVIPTLRHELRAKLAFKRVEDYSEGMSGTTHNHLVLAQYLYRFARSWDADLWGRFQGQATAGTRQLGAGIEVGCLVLGHVRVAAGYSIEGFEDRDVAERDAWVEGFGVRVQLILTDWLMDQIGIVGLRQP